MPDAAVRKRSFALGYLLGLAGMPLPEYKRRVPAYCLYNGVSLPPLPEYDSGKYPYACIMAIHWAGDSSDGFYTLYCSTTPMTYDGTGYREAPGSYATYDLTENVWELFEEGTNDEEGYTWESTELVTNRKHWANYDLLDTRDNSVHLAGSAAIPVFGGKADE